MPRWLRRWRDRQDRMRHTLRGTYAHRLLGERIFHPQIWGFDLNSLAGGLSLGLFIAFTPTIPFHMLLCVVFAIILRVNLPIALAACWITNPVTALPVFLAARRLGQFLLENSRLSGFVLDIFGFETRTGRFMENSLYVWAGSLIFAMVAALAGNIALRILWMLSHRVKARIVHQDDDRSGGQILQPVVTEQHGSPPEL